MMTATNKFNIWTNKYKILSLILILVTLNDLIEYYSIRELSTYDTTQSFNIVFKLNIMFNYIMASFYQKWTEEYEWYEVSISQGGSTRFSFVLNLHAKSFVEWNLKVLI